MMAARAEAIAGILHDHVRGPGRRLICSCADRYTVSAAPAAARMS